MALCWLYGFIVVAWPGLAVRQFGLILLAMQRFLQMTSFVVCCLCWILATVSNIMIIRDDERRSVRVMRAAAAMPGQP